MRQHVTPLALALVLSGCAAAASPTPTLRALSGSFTLSQEKALDQTATTCRGTGGYSDVGSGVRAVIRDDTGRTIGAAPIVYEPERLHSDGTPVDRFSCRFTFAVSVPDAPFYTVEVGDRGELTYSRADLESQGWALELTLGE